MQKRKRVLGVAIGTMLSLGLLINPNAELSPVYGADAPVAIDETNFPDAVFREYVKDNFDTDGNEELSVSEMESVTEIILNNLNGEFVQNITDLTGIEYFPIKKLQCIGHQLSSLDVSQNADLEDLNCENNNLSSLDVSRNTALKTLSCSDNNLSSLDVSRNTALEKLYCDGNNLSSLDVSQNTALEVLSCENNNLSSLDVRRNRELVFLDCDRNKLNSLDVSQNTMLRQLRCENNGLSSLDVSRNTALERLDCGGDKLSSLDVSQNTVLSELHCGANNLSSLDVSRNTALERLDCDGNYILLPLYQSGSEYYIDLSSLSLDTGRVLNSSVGSYNAENGHIEGLTLDINGSYLTYQYNVDLKGRIMEVTVHISGEPIIVTEASTSAPNTESTASNTTIATEASTSAPGTESTAGNTAQNTPKTGDTMLPVWVAILGLFSTISYLITKKRSGIK